MTNVSKQEMWVTDNKKISEKKQKLMSKKKKTPKDAKEEPVFENILPVASEGKIRHSKQRPFDEYFTSFLQCF